MVKETARQRVEIEAIRMSADQVNSDALLIYDAGIELYEFVKAHNLLPPLPTAPPAARAQEQGGTEETSRA